MSGFLAERRRRLLALKKLRERGGATPSQPSCPSCAHGFSGSELPDNQYVCPYCGHHLPIAAWERLRLIADEGSLREIDAALMGTDPLEFPGYEEKLTVLRREIHMGDAVVCALARIDGRKVAVAALDTRFLMGSMGAVVGEKLTRLIERAARSHLPLIIFSASGGARMQEGIVSLMQMAKTAAAVERFSAKGGLFISVAANPTTGGVTASFASLGDVMLAEPGALVGFAGPRVIEQTIGEKLPDGFQRAEYLLDHGFLDAVVPRVRMKGTLSQLLALHAKGGSSHVR